MQLRLKANRGSRPRGGAGALSLATDHAHHARGGGRGAQRRTTWSAPLPWRVLVRRPSSRRPERHRTGRRIATISLGAFIVAESPACLGIGLRPA
ncbi:hypothetical protein QJS66_12045 [Kocuria rhizophila]|nr:hypothetical protein QJS66_12045 [Kocuria rhizophila]